MTVHTIAKSRTLLILQDLVTEKKNAVYTPTPLLPKLPGSWSTQEGSGRREKERREERKRGEKDGKLMGRDDMNADHFFAIAIGTERFTDV